MWMRMSCFENGDIGVWKCGMFGRENIVNKEEELISINLNEKQNTLTDLDSPEILRNELFLLYLRKLPLWH